MSGHVEGFTFNISLIISASEPWEYDHRQIEEIVNRLHDALHKVRFDAGGKSHSVIEANVWQVGATLGSLSNLARRGSSKG
jgi:hypothetical protein